MGYGTEDYEEYGVDAYQRRSGVRKKGFGTENQQRKKLSFNEGIWNGRLSEEKRSCRERATRQRRSARHGGLIVK